MIIDARVPKAKPHDAPSISYNMALHKPSAEEPDHVPEHIYGLAPVLEALRSGRRPIARILIATGAAPSRLIELQEVARRQRIPVERRDRRDLDGLTRQSNHQGIVAVLGAQKGTRYAELTEILENPGDPALIVLLDSVEDPQNLGAILRTCDGAGVGGVVVPDRRQAPLNETVSKTSAGAVEYVRVAEVPNLVPLIETLKDSGYWVIGVEGDGEKAYTDFDFKIPLALVFGSEAKGLRPLVRKRCDVVVQIPMKGKLNSLNVSVAAGVVLFEVLRQRGTR